MAATVKDGDGLRTRTLDVGGPLHVADFGASGPTVVCVHGLGGSHLNWLAAGPLLAERARVVALDLPGFGYSPPAGRDTDVWSGARLLDRFIARESARPVLLVGISMGAALSLVEAAEHPERVAGLVLVDPSLPLEWRVGLDPLVLKTFAAYCVPGLGERLLRRWRVDATPEQIVRETLRMCCVDPARVPSHVVDAAESFARDRAGMAYADAAFLAAARSLVGLVLLRRRRYRRIIDAVQAPTLVVHGEQDRLVQIGAAHRLVRRRRDWTLVTLEDVGHLPPLEDARGFTDAVFAWLDGDGREPWAAAAKRSAGPGRDAVRPGATPGALEPSGPG